MEVWILVLWLGAASPAPPHELYPAKDGAITTAEFTSQSRCLNALEQVKARGRIDGICVKK